MGTGKIIQADNIDGLKTVKNFISNGNATLNTSGWVTYKDAAGTRPVDGTGGSPTLVTFTRTTTSPLDDAASFLFSVAGGSSAQGEGASFGFTIGSAYKAKVLKIEADYIVNSGTFAAGSDTTASDVIVYIYDVTNGVLIEPSSFKFLSNSSTISDKFSATFQTASNSTSYRLILHVASASTQAYSLKFDNLAVSPSSYVYGTPFTTPSSFVPTGSLTTSATYTGFKHQEGNFLVQKTDIAFGGTNTQGAVNINLPPGLTIDTNLIDTTFFKNVISLNGGLTIGSTTYSIAAVTNGTNKSFRIVFVNVKTDDAGIASDPTKFNSVDTSANLPAAIASGATLSVTVRVPILGWSSSVQVSDGYDGRVIAANVRRAPTGAQSIPNNAYTAIGFDVTSGDTTTSWVLSRTSGSSYYLVPSSGWYRVSALAGTVAAGGSILAIAVNSTIGADYRLGSTTTTALASGSRDIELKAGDKVYITIYQNSGSAQNLNEFWVEASISKLAGNPVISASETVAARYTTASGQAINNGASAVINFDTKVYDTHGAVTVGASWVFKAPTEGLYAVDVGTGSPAAANVFAANNVWQHVLRKNQTGQYSYPGAFSVQASGSQALYVNGSDTVYLLAGETLDLQLFNNTGVNRTLLTTAAANYISIRKVK